MLMFVAKFAITYTCDYIHLRYFIYNKAFCNMFTEILVYFFYTIKIDLI